MLGHTRYSDFVSYKLQGNLHFSVKIQGQINKLWFGVYNFAILATFVLYIGCFFALY